MTQSTAPLTGAPSAGALIAEEVAAIRADFPYLERPARNGKALAYLDWAATSQKPAGVITTEADFYRMSNGAAGRSTYQLADEATATFEDARDAVAAFVGARGSELVFTKNATEAINLVALAIGHASLGRSAARGGGPAATDDPSRRLIIGQGDEVVVTRAEHHANLVPWQELCARTGATLRWLDLTEDGRIDSATTRVMTERTRVLALTHASNVTGAITPLAGILPALFLMGASLMLVVVWTSPIGFVVSTCLMGFGNGFGSGIVMTRGADLAPTTGRERFLGWWQGIGNIGAAAGPFVVSTLTATLGLVAGMRGTAFLGVVGGAWAWVAMPRAYARVGIDLRGRALANGEVRRGRRLSAP